MTQRAACITLRVPLRGICLAAPTRAARLRPSIATGGGIGILPMVSIVIGKMPMPLCGRWRRSEFAGSKLHAPCSLLNLLNAMNLSPPDIGAYAVRGCLASLPG